jgi:hypothetical protein
MISFKQRTGRCALAWLVNPPTRFWQREWFDHWSRSPQEDERIITYIRRNPMKAGLVKHYTDWPFGSWRDEQPAPPLVNTNSTPP